MFEIHLPKILKGKRISASSKDIEPQEVFLDYLARKKDNALGIFNIKIEVLLPITILRGFFVSIVLLFSLLLGLTFNLSVNNYKKYTALAQQNKFVVRSVESSRGVIYDSKGNQLVLNKPSFNLIVRKNELPKDEAGKENIIKSISNIIGEDENRIKEKIDNGKIDKPILIAEIIDHDKLVILETRITEFTGFSIEKSTVREYIDGPLYSGIIGYTGVVGDEQLKEKPDEYFPFDQVGVAGLEKSYEDALRKNPGQLRIERDAYGNEISREIVELPDSGQSLVLWLDAGLQKKIEEEVRKTMENVGASKAIGVAINPKTGGILAMVSIPGFDNNLFTQRKDSDELKALLKDTNNSLLNRVISGKYVVGSIIKPFIASAALSENIITADKVLNTPGKLVITNKYDPSVTYEFNDWIDHGWADMRKAIAESCNVYFYKIGGGYEDQKGLGPTNIKKYLELYGWGDKTGIDLPNEAKGFIPSVDWKKQVRKEPWWDGDTYNISIGQGDFSITPLEVANAYAAIANNGTLYKPKLVKEMVDSEKNVVEVVKPEVIRQNFINPEYLQVVREGMRNAVTAENAPHASCKILNDLPVAVASKTGTAQTSAFEHYHNWITVFAPYDDPQIVMTIMIENVNKQMATVIPTAKEILKWYFTEDVKVSESVSK